MPASHTKRATRWARSETCSAPLALTYALAGLTAACTAALPFGSDARSSSGLVPLEGAARTRALQAAMSSAAVRSLGAKHASLDCMPIAEPSVERAGDSTAPRVFVRQTAQCASGRLAQLVYAAPVDAVDGQSARVFALHTTFDTERSALALQTVREYSGALYAKDVDTIDVQSEGGHAALAARSTEAVTTQSSARRHGQGDPSCYEQALSAQIAGRFGLASEPWAERADLCASPAAERVGDARFGTQAKAASAWSSFMSFVSSLTNWIVGLGTESDTDAAGAKAPEGYSVLSADGTADATSAGGTVARSATPCGWRFGLNLFCVDDDATSTQANTRVATSTTASGGSSTSFKMPIVAIRYLPDEAPADGQIDSTAMEKPVSVAELRQRIERMEAGIVTAMTTATRYKGRTPPALEYSMLRTFDISSAPPRGRMYSYNTTFRPDYNRILSSVNICDFVDNQGVREVWLWTQHYHGIEPAESNLSSSFGDISNSERDPNDMPRCKHAYTLYNYNYERDVAEALHDHGHQLEAIFDAAGAFNRNASEASFWKTFVGRDTSGKLSTSQVHRCGWTHYPPNAAKDYDYRSAATVLSDCDDWNPEGGGQTTQVNCSTWNQTYYGDPTCRDDGGLAFYVWWMQRIPGYGNTVRAGNCRMRNWWEFVANMDGVFGSKQYFCLPPSTQPAT